ncbi:hypothetical protein RJ639_044099 [Escallonia herrerae]|uniref:mRNA cap guanine-N(7) methyltransferase 2 n=1 Tax=Escallonia herrerae TaxID=1293975 RepID=A0AA89B938_9ASTE|nr:hypothetical protein RJ639_044099 [Escallonia herrerae]
MTSANTRKTAESAHQRLIEFVKTALIKIFVSPYATVCELYCVKVCDEEKWDEAQIGHYIGVDGVPSGVSDVRQAWESQRKTYTSHFLELDPCIENIELQSEDKGNMAEYCLLHAAFAGLSMFNCFCFETEERVRRLLHNVSSLLKPGGFFLGITPDSSTIWAKYQKNVEAHHNKSGMKPNIVPNCIRSESCMITFEVEEEKFPFFGKKYQLKLANDISAETHCLVHFPSLIRLSIILLSDPSTKCISTTCQNLTDSYDDNRAQFAGMLLDAGHSLVDPRGRHLSRSYDVLGLYTTFIFQKPDPDVAPPLMTPLLKDTNPIMTRQVFIIVRSI